MAQIRVAIVAPSAIVRKGLEALVASGPNLALAGAAAEISGIPDVSADVLLWENATPEDLSQGPVISIIPDSEGTPWLDFLRAGGSGVLPAAVGPDELYAAIAAVAAGLTVAPASWYAAPPPQTASVLTTRELEVLTLLAEGAPNKIIAYRLGISEHTVKFHLNSVFTKLGVSTRTEAVMAGMRQGLLTV